MLFKHNLYEEDIHSTANNTGINWNCFLNKNILITGATGLIGTFLIDLLMYRNNIYNNNITIYAVSRSKEKIVSRFGEYINSPFFVFIHNDIQHPCNSPDAPIDYIIHGASNTHPLAYSGDPINTIMLSVSGTRNILDYASSHNVMRTLFLSTVEIYGENRGDVDTFTEDYCGYIDCNTLRAGYPEGKRTAEALCQAYIKEKNIDTVIARCCRVYGPTMGTDDSKAIAQFIRNTVNNEKIVLKSKGGQLYSYCYVADICSALLILLLNGNSGEAYNIAESSSNFTLFQIAGILSQYAGSEVTAEIPTTQETIGYSKATKALLDNSKMKSLGWEPHYCLTKGLRRTVEILRASQ